MILHTVAFFIQLFGFIFFCKKKDIDLRFFWIGWALFFMHYEMFFIVWTLMEKFN